MPDRPVPLPYALERPPAARALLRGSSAYPQLWGEALFYPFLNGSLIIVRATGLPSGGFFPLHVHRAGDCRTGGDIPFCPAGESWDGQDGSVPPGGAVPGGQNGQVGPGGGGWGGAGPEPAGAGVLPPLLSDGGLAYAMMYTGGFTPEGAAGRSLVLHRPPEHAALTPRAGAEGERIACGVIQPL